MPSTAISDFDYDPEKRELSVTFVTGRIYIYEDVSEDVAADFETAESKGQFFNTYVRNAYSFRKVR